MDDSCAVCAESLSWVAYGPCGHREVCSTCVVRLRFVLEDRRCCICKVESPVVFVTKAMGDFTKAITDFSTFSFKENEGQRGEYWYHEDSQAYFDDVDQYKMIKAMCRLSCSICDKNVYDKGGGDAWNRRNGFRSIEQLKGHLFHRHALFMCSLCLEGRKGVNRALEVAIDTTKLVMVKHLRKVLLDKSNCLTSRTQFGAILNGNLLMEKNSKFEILEN